MPEYSIYYDDDTVEHLDQHGVTIDEFSEVLNDPDSVEIDPRTGNEIAYGYTSALRYPACVYYRVDDESVVAVTAFDVKELK
jgi:uncharacterized DUF497 family protein